MSSSIMISTTILNKLSNIFHHYIIQFDINVDDIECDDDLLTQILIKSIDNGKLTITDLYLIKNDSVNSNIYLSEIYNPLHTAPNSTIKNNDCISFSKKENSIILNAVIDSYENLYK